LVYFLDTMWSQTSLIHLIPNADDGPGTRHPTGILFRKNNENIWHSNYIGTSNDKISTPGCNWQIHQATYTWKCSQLFKSCILFISQILWKVTWFEW
jgi:hypothetical protein